ncbi:EcsC family protein [Chitinophaga sedimenti]|uniref:EcsC family protein n=1 Tax=Chitinophaga sedimenti TaxID=2033606 RepID=UPI002003EF43|nr:EcsC family protein [Chitinophaga sedimenti]MCK7554291.1 EcsC family protein [Chitinophaga sedimenti]
MLYEQQAKLEMEHWQQRMRKRPSWIERATKGVQDRINKMIPESVHEVITTAIKQMVRGVLFGSAYTAPSNQEFASLHDLEEAVRKRVSIYRHTAAAEGGITGAGGFLMGLADFPILLAIKLKLLFDIATFYGFDVKDYKERVYILQVFILAFSSQQHRQKVFKEIENWKQKAKDLPEDIQAFDWLHFQQEYRDHIDLAKMAQLVPVIGAAVGVVVNYRLINKLGETAINAYRMRLAARGDL